VAFVTGEYATAELIQNILKQDGVSVNGEMQETAFALSVKKHLANDAVSGLWW